MPGIFQRWRDQPSWSRIASVSIVVNMFLIAVIAGHVVHRELSELQPGTPMLARALANAEANLSRPDAAAFDSAIRGEVAQYRDVITALNEARQGFEKQVSAESFDPAATQQALVEWRQSWNRFWEKFSPTLVRALGKISPEGRRKLVAEGRKGHITGAISQ